MTSDSLVARRVGGGDTGARRHRHRRSRAGAAQRPRLDRAVLDAIPLRLIGPSAPSGRVWNVVGVPGQPKTFYACTAEGGVWRTTNHGTTMTPIFDEENAAVCGAVAVAPSDPEHHLGRLGRTGRAPVERPRLRRLQVDRRRQDLAAPRPREPPSRSAPSSSTRAIRRRSTSRAMGHLWGRNAERGVFKTTDGGRTWRKVLYVDDMTGCIDLAHRPSRSERPLRDHVAAPAVGRRGDARVGSGQRDLQEHGRRRALDASDQRAARTSRSARSRWRSRRKRPGWSTPSSCRASRGAAGARATSAASSDRRTAAPAGGASARSSPRAPTTRTSRSIRRTTAACSSSTSSCGDPTTAARTG